MAFKGFQPLYWQMLRPKRVKVNFEGIGSTGYAGGPAWLAVANGFLKK
jgi:hypothetical protein